jgi:3-hydroxyisobutyrate dehydrogenase-like beta-hydroxyacid dehydrogenase
VGRDEHGEPRRHARDGQAAAARGAALIDAPVSGSAVTVEAGQLSFMVGGDPAALEKFRPHVLAIGPTITHVGELGLAVAMKIATNLNLAVQMLAFCEAVALAEKAGIDRERAVEVLLKSVIAFADGQVPRTVRAGDARRAPVRCEHEQEGSRSAPSRWDAHSAWRCRAWRSSIR